MFYHLEFSVADINATRRFYGPVCVAIGMREIFFDDSEKSAGFEHGEVVPRVRARFPQRRTTSGGLGGFAIFRSRLPFSHQVPEGSMRKVTTFACVRLLVAQCSDFFELIDD